MSTHETPLKYLTTTKIGEKGQLTVPKQFREDLGLGYGQSGALPLRRAGLQTCSG